MGMTKCDATGGPHRFTQSINKNRHVAEEPFCTGCGTPNPRCATCGRKVDIRENGSVRCAKGHTFHRPERHNGGVRDIRELATMNRRRPRRGEHA